MKFYATTTLFANSGKAYDFSIAGEVRNNRITNVTELSTDCQVYPSVHQLILLADKLLAPQESDAQLYGYRGRNCTHVACEIRGKQYRLDQKVGPTWLQNPHLPSIMTAWMRDELYRPNFEGCDWYFWVQM